MKFANHLIFFFICLGLSVSFKICIFGDPGQFDVLYPLGIPAPLKTGAKIPAVNTPPMTYDCKINGTKISKMSNWEGVLGAMSEHLQSADQAVVLGDMVYPESKFASNKYKDGFWVPLESGEDAYDYWQRRLVCAWKGFFISTKNALSRYEEKYINGDKLSSRFQIIPGNHLYDINPKVEVREMNYITTENDEFSWYPTGTEWSNGVRVQRIEEDNQVIYFIDFNSAVFETVSSPSDKVYEGSSDTILNDIEANMKNGWWNLEGVNREDIFFTIEGVFEALQSVEKEPTNKPTIRALRAHHPFFNLEGDPTGMFQYKSKLNGLTLIEACKKANINFYFASHHHSNQMWAFDYSKVSSLTGKAARGSNNFKTNGVKDPLKNYECFPTDCREYSLSTGIDLSNQKYLYVFVIGNSGRVLEAINPDVNSYGTLLYGRSRNTGANKSDVGRWKSNHQGNIYGGTVAKFVTENGQTSINIEFYENENGVARRSGSLNLTTGKSQDIEGFVQHTPSNRLKKRLF